LAVGAFVLSGEVWIAALRVRETAQFGMPPATYAGSNEFHAITIWSAGLRK